MPIYFGKGVPGEPDFECHEFTGFPVSKCGKYWGSGPVDKEGYLIIDAGTHEHTHKSKYHK